MKYDGLTGGLTPHLCPVLRVGGAVADSCQSLICLTIPTRRVSTLWSSSPLTSTYLIPCRLARHRASVEIFLQTLNCQTFLSFSPSTGTCLLLTRSVLLPTSMRGRVPVRPPCHSLSRISLVSSRLVLSVRLNTTTIHSFSPAVSGSLDRSQRHKVTRLQLFSRSITKCHTVTQCSFSVSQCNSVTVSQCHSVRVSQCHSVTVSQCHSVTYHVFQV